MSAVAIKRNSYKKKQRFLLQVLVGDTGKSLLLNVATLLRLGKVIRKFYKMQIFMTLNSCGTYVDRTGF